MVSMLLQVGRELRDVGAENVIGDDGLQKIEPEERRLSKNPAFIRNTGAEDMIEGRDAIRGDEEKLVCTRFVEVAYFATSDRLKRREVGLE